MGGLRQVGGGLAPALGPGAGDGSIQLIRCFVPASGDVFESPVYACGKPAAEQPILAREQVYRLEQGRRVAVLPCNVTGPECGCDRDPAGVVAPAGS